MSPGRTCKAIQLACRLCASRSTFVSTSVHCALNPRDPHSLTQTNRGVWGAQRASPSGRRPAGGQRAKPPHHKQSSELRASVPSIQGTRIHSRRQTGGYGGRSERRRLAEGQPAVSERSPPSQTKPLRGANVQFNACGRSPSLPSERLHGIQFCRLERRDKPEDQTDRRTRRERDDQRGR